MPHRARKLAPHADLPAAPRRRTPAAPGPPAAVARCACRDVAVGDRLVAADDAGRACVVRQIKKGGWLVVSWGDAPGRAYAPPSPFRRPAPQAAPGGES